MKQLKNYLKVFQGEAKGFFLIEVIVVSAVIGTVLIFLLGSIQNSVEASQRSLERTQAAYLLEEGFEIVKAIRNQSNGWETITNLAVGTNYYANWTGSVWTLTTVPTQTGIFTRTIVKANVLRDSNDDISSSGTADLGTMQFTNTVVWQSPSGTKTETLSFYISNINE